MEWPLSLTDSCLRKRWTSFHFQADRIYLRCFYSYITNANLIKWLYHCEKSKRRLKLEKWTCQQNYRLENAPRRMSLDRKRRDEFENQKLSRLLTASQQGISKAHYEELVCCLTAQKGIWLPYTWGACAPTWAESVWNICFHATTLSNDPPMMSWKNLFHDVGSRKKIGVIGNALWIRQNAFCWSESLKQSLGAWQTSRYINQRTWFERPWKKLT